MWIKRDVGAKQLTKSCISLFLWLCVAFVHPTSLLFAKDLGVNSSKSFDLVEAKKVKSVQFDKQPQVYYLYISDFIESFIEIPTSTVTIPSTTVSSRYLAGRAPIYNLTDQKVGICSASFLCMQNANGIYNDISNYISLDNGLIVTWFTPTTLINLELDSILHSMVTECIVLASTKVGFNPFYGQTFNLIVSSDDQRIYFQFTRTGAIF